MNPKEWLVEGRGVSSSYICFSLVKFCRSFLDFLEKSIRTSNCSKKRKMRKARLVILPIKCLHQMGFLLLFLSCPVIGDWGRIRPETETSHRAIRIARQGSCGMQRDPPEGLTKAFKENESKRCGNGEHVFEFTKEIPWEAKHEIRRLDTDTVEWSRKIDERQNAVQRSVINEREVRRVAEEQKGVRRILEGRRDVIRVEERRGDRRTAERREYELNDFRSAEERRDVRKISGELGGVNRLSVERRVTEERNNVRRLSDERKDFRRVEENLPTKRGLKRFIRDRTIESQKHEIARSRSLQSNFRVSTLNRRAEERMEREARDVRLASKEERTSHRLFLSRSVDEKRGKLDRRLSLGRQTEQRQDESFRRTNPREQEIQKDRTIADERRNRSENNKSSGRSSDRRRVESLKRETESRRREESEAKQIRLFLARIEPGGIRFTGNREQTTLHSRMTETSSAQKSRIAEVRQSDGRTTLTRRNGDDWSARRVLSVPDISKEMEIEHIDNDGRKEAKEVGAIASAMSEPQDLIENGKIVSKGESIVEKIKLLSYDNPRVGEWTTNCVIGAIAYYLSSRQVKAI